MADINLRRFRQEDADLTVKIFLNDQVKKTYMLPDLTEEAAYKLFDRFLTCSNDDNRYVRAVCLGEHVVGWLNDTDYPENGIELGWVIDLACHNKGYATAAVKLAIIELFAAGFRRVVAGAFSSNFASIRVMEKSGMKRMDITEDIEYRGQTHCCVYYQIECPEYIQ